MTGGGCSCCGNRLFMAFSVAATRRSLCLVCNCGATILLSEDEYLRWAQETRPPLPPTCVMEGVTIKGAGIAGVENNGAFLDMRGVTILGSPTGVQLRDGGTVRANSCTFDPDPRD